MVRERVREMLLFHHQGAYFPYHNFLEHLYSGNIISFNHPQPSNSSYAEREKTVTTFTSSSTLSITIPRHIKPSIPILSYNSIQASSVLPKYPAIKADVFSFSFKPQTIALSSTNNIKEEKTGQIRQILPAVFPLSPSFLRSNTEISSVITAKKHTI